MKRKIKGLFKPPTSPVHPPQGPSTPIPFPDGIAVLHECPDATVDICFVHGLTGNRESTWTARGQSTPWPKALLPTKLPQARILTYGYDAYIVRKSVAGSYGLEEHATNLLHDLSADRLEHGASSRALIFIAHSLGGLVCKRAILRSRNHREVHLRDISNCTKGIIFMGTPHRGSWMAQWAGISARALGLVKSTNKSLLEVLETDNQFLHAIQADFGSMIQELRESNRPIQVRCFFEELPLPGIGEVVSKDSATLDDYSPMSIHANHRDMVKFSTVDDSGFKRVCAELLRWISDIRTPHDMDEKDQQCLQELWAIDPGDNKARIEKTKGGLLEDSYIWIFKDPAFQRWYENGQDRLLWIRGDPGKGKTMLLCGIINKLKESITQSHLLSFHFCQATDSQTNNATAVLRSLICQLIYQQPSLITPLREKYNRQGSALFEHVNAWFALYDVFITILKDKVLKNAFLVVDALDECAIGQAQLLDLILETSEAHANIKWIVSSRHSPDVEDHLDTATRKIIISLELNHKSISTAVDIYIRHKVRQLSKLKNYTRDTEDMVQDYLLSNANDTFLWVSLVCQDLANPKVRPHHAHLKMREKFPPGLNDLYWRMMDQISGSEDANICRQILAVISVVYRPLSLDELASLIELPDSIPSNGYLEDIIKLCGSFLMLQDNVISFIHQSAKDFLIEIAVKEIFPSGIYSEHQNVFSRSLQVINGNLERDIYKLRSPGFPITRVKIPHPDPLAAVRYSCIHWVDHLHHFYSSQARGVEENSKDGGLIGEFMTETYLHWLEALSLLGSISEGILSMSKLERLFQIDAKGSPLTNLISDANRFIKYHKGAIENSPLQTYYSTLIFSPEDSLIRKAFASKKPEWLTVKPKIKGGWSACLQTFENHDGPVNALTFSRDSKLLASAPFNGTVTIWEISSGKCLHVLGGHSVPVASVVFSHDSRFLASWGRSVKLWDVSSGRCLQTFEAHGNLRKLSARSDPIWHLETPLALTIGDHEVCIRSIAFSGESKLIALGSSDEMSGIWDMSSNACLHTFKCPIEREDLAVFSYDSRHFAVSSSRTVRIYDTNSGECLHTLDAPFNSVTLSHDFKFLASYNSRRPGLGNGLRILDASTGKYLEFATNTEFHSITFSYTSELLALMPENKTVEIWDFTSNRCLQILRGHDSHPRLTAFSHDSRLLASVAFDGVVMIWDISGGKYQQAIENSNEPYVPLRAVVLSRDLKFLATESNDQRIQIWDTSSGECLQTLRSDEAPVKRMVFSPNSQLLASVFVNRTIRIWSIGSTECLTILGSHDRHVDFAHFAQFSHDSKLLVTSSIRDRTVKAWDCSSGKCLWTVSNECAHSASFSHDSKFLASSPTSSDNSIVNLRDLQNGEYLGTLKGLTGAVRFAVFSHDSALVALVLFDKSMRIYNVTSHECLQILKGHTGHIATAAFSSDSRLFASAGYGGIVRIWDVRNGQCQQSWDIGFYRPFISFDSTSSYIHTDMGNLRVSPASEVQPLIVGRAKPRFQGCGRRGGGKWITWNSKPVLWIPPEYRSGHFVVVGSTVFIIRHSGEVLSLKFDAQRLSRSIGRN